jgi:hypothetical protein
MALKRSEPSKHCAFRLNAENHRLLQERARLCGLSEGQYARTVLLDHLTRSGDAGSALGTEALKDILRQEFGELGSFLAGKIDEIVAGQNRVQTRTLDQALRNLHANLARVMEFLSCNLAPAQGTGPTP